LVIWHRGHKKHHDANDISGIVTVMALLKNVVIPLKKEIHAFLTIQKNGLHPSMGMTSCIFREFFQ